MKNNELLSDIEDDIFGDWKDIQKKIINKEIEKRVFENEDIIQQIDCPDFKEFYIILLRIMQSWDGNKDLDPRLLSDLHSLLRMVFSGIDDWPNPVPKSFYKVWEIFCSPRHYKCDRGIRCEKCMKEYDVFYKEQVMNARALWEERLQDDTVMERTVERVQCPNCGYSLVNYVNRKVFGIFVHDGERVTGNDIRREFKYNFQG